MSRSEEPFLGAIAVKHGFCTQAQLDNALCVLKEVQTLGLSEQLGTILVKKKYISPQQLKEILKIQGQKAKVHIAGYEIIEKLGQGGMGAVFKARQISLDRIVALKILTPKLASDKQFVARFIKEARAVAKLSHPNIIVGIDVGMDSKYCYFAMEYVEGDTALRALRDQGVFSEKRALGLARQIARALKHADKHKLVHRDLKPDNIMLNSRDEAKLCDLGLAKRMEAKDAGMTQVGSAVGTPHYISPEQARGAGNVRITADIYCLGTTLYHLVTGKTLFNAENATATMTKHLLEEAPTAKKFQPELSDHFCQLLEKMLAKRAENRHQTPDELLEDLQWVQHGHPIKATLPPKAKSSMAKWPKGKGLGRSAFRSSAGSKYSSGTRAPIDRPDPTTQHRKPVNDSSGLLLIGAVAGLLLVVALGAAFLSGSRGRNRDNARQSRERRNGTSKDALSPSRRTSDPGDTNHNDDTKPLAGEETAGALTYSEQSIGDSTQPPNWAPLDDARKACKENPTDYVHQLKLYQEALYGAPQAVIGTIHQERDRIQQSLDAAFDEALKTKLNEAKTLLGSGSPKAGLALLTPTGFPKILLAKKNKNKLAEAHKRLESSLWLRFKKNTQVKTDRLLQQARTNPKRLRTLDSALKEAEAAYPIPGVLAYTKATRAKGIPYSGRILSILPGENGKEILLATGSGQRQRIAVQKLAPETILGWSTRDLEKNERRFLRGKLHFWKGNLNTAYAEFMALRDAPEFKSASTMYLDWMERMASSLIAETFRNHKVALSKDSSLKLAETLRKDARAMILRLQRDFKETESYRALPSD